MKSAMKKLLIWAFFLFPLAALLLLPTQPAAAQTDPTTTPADGYPPPATPALRDESYPIQPPPGPTATDGPYIAPTTVVYPETEPTAVIGGAAPVATIVATLPISQSSLVRNRAILWAGFLLTMFIFGLAVYGAMLMYTRSRS